MTMNNNQPDQVENVQQFTAILQVRQYYINDNEQQPARLIVINIILSYL
jgi:hypothetical protein